MQLTPNITLSTGRTIGSRYAANGSQELFDITMPDRVASLTGAEHVEAMAAIHAFRHTKPATYSDHHRWVGQDKVRVGFRRHVDRSDKGDQK